jgi:hypothetical protein
MPRRPRIHLFNFFNFSLIFLVYVLTSACAFWHAGKLNSQVVLVAAYELPANLIERFAGSTEESLMRRLVFLAPLTGMESSK